MIKLKNRINNFYNTLDDGLYTYKNFFKSSTENMELIEYNFKSNINVLENNINNLKKLKSELDKYNLNSLRNKDLYNKTYNLLIDKIEILESELKEIIEFEKKFNDIKTLFKEVI